MKTQISIDHWGCNRLIRLIALILALAVAAPVLLAQESDPLNGRKKHDQESDLLNRRKKHDPTGAWLIRSSITTDAGKNVFFLTVFHQGGTLTADIQGESAFDPAATTDPDNRLNIITSPQSGVWQKTGPNTFAATWLAMEYRVQTQPASSPLFRFDKVQYIGTLNKSGDTMELTAHLIFFDEQGKQVDENGEPSTGEGIPFTATGARIPLEILPGDSLPIPPVPTPP